MAPNPRRPGVDADIVQASTVRGYDSPLLANPPEDLVLSSGKNTANNAVSKVLLWNRTDSVQAPLLELRPGAVLAAAPRFGVFAGALADPNGVITSSIGSLYVSNNPAKLWQNLDGAQVWKVISDDTGGESLAQTLVIGNITGGRNIVLSVADKLLGEDSALVAGGPLTLVGGSATGLVGGGGDVLVSSGSSVGGATGKIELTTPSGTGSNSSGLVLLSTGAATGGANSGGITLRTGTSGAAGVGGSAGSIGLFGGVSEATGGSTSRGGSIFLGAGRARTDGEGGSLFLRAGNSSNVDPIYIVLPPAPGRGGSVLLQGGASAGAQTGGAATVQAGTGGSAGGAGGSVFLRPGSGGGGGADGTVQAVGILTATNMVRGNGDPNGVVPGDEGYVYQQADGGQGSLWVNTNGSVNGWGKLALAGSLVEVLAKAQQGYVVPSGAVLVNTDADRISNVGLFKGLSSISAVGGVLDHGSATPAGGALLDMQFQGGIGSTSGLDMSAALGTPIFALEHKFFAVFKFRNTGIFTTQRMFMGYSSNDLVTQLASDNPAIGQYVGLVKSGSSTNWFFVNRGGVGFDLVNSAVTAITTSTGGDPFYYIIDAREIDGGTVRHTILDKDFVQLATYLADNPGGELPFATTRISPLMGGINLAAANPASLQIFVASIVTEALALEGGGGGGGGANQTLEQTLQFGNTTGVLPILISQGSYLRGETDGDGGNGSPLLLSSGLTTIAANNTGQVLITSSNLAIAAASGETGPVSLVSGSHAGVGSTGDTGDALIGSGPILDAAAAGSTGAVRIGSGDHSGLGGQTGDIEIYSGRHLGTGGTDGDILLIPGGPNVNPSTPGNVDIRGGATSLAGPSGSVYIRSGVTSFLGNTGEVLIRTSNAPNTGNAGTISLLGGSGGGLNGEGGPILIQSGSAAGIGVDSFGGAINILSGSGTLHGGAINLTAGLSTAQDGRDITLTAGDSAALVGGSIVLNPGTGPGGDGEVTINGKLTVTGLIDPTGMLFDGQVAVPSAVAAGEGLVWVDNTGAPSRLIFTDDAGTDVVLGSGGATTLASLSDVSIAGPVIGEILTYNGATWQNLPGAGGSPLATILALGTATGANDIVVNTGQQLTAQTDLLLNPGAGVGDQVVIDGLRWPSVDGLAGNVLTTDGAGNLTFSPGMGGTGETFAQALSRLQTGSAVPPNQGLATAEGFGIYDVVEENHAAFYLDTQGLPVGPRSRYGTGAVLNQDCGIYDQNYCTNEGRRSLTTWKLAMPSTLFAHRLFVGLSNASTAPDFFDNQMVSDNPAVVHVGIAYSSDLLDAVYRFVIDVDGVSFTSAASTVAAGAFARHIEVDLVTTGEATIRILDINGVELDSHTFVGVLDPARDLAPAVCLRAREANQTTVDVYSIMTINQAFLVGGIGGGGTQTLAQVLFFGNQTGGLAIQGDDSAVGDGSDLEFVGGSSTGGGGDGGHIIFTGGAPDPAGTGNAGDFRFDGTPGAPNGIGSNVALRAGNGLGTGPGGFAGLAAGEGLGSGDGGLVGLEAGNSVTGLPGIIQLLAGSPSAGAGAGAIISLTSGTGGPAGGDGGDIVLNPGPGSGGGNQGEVVVNGPMHITGKLTVDGLIDPPGLLMTPSVGAPFVPAPGEGGVWVNLLGELIYTNTGGDLNLSDLAPTSGIFLDAFMIAGYGFLSPGSVTTTTPQSSGVLGNSALKDLAVGGTAVLGYDSEGPLLALSTAAAVSSHSVIGTEDVFLSRNQKLRTRIKFQPTSVAHTDERLFVGFSTDPVVQIDTDDPVANEYVGLRKSLAGITLDFVARGAGGAMVPVVAWPIDSAVHYLDLDFTDPSQIRFILYADDAVTIQATATVLTGGTLPTVTTGMSIACGVGTAAGAVRSMDFYSASVVTRGDLLGAILGGGSGVPATLAQTLLLGSSTGTSNITISTGQGLFGETDLVLNPGAGVGEQVVLDGLRWPEADGGANTFLSTDGAGNLSFTSPTLDDVLSAGNTSGTNDLIMDSLQTIRGAAALLLSGATGGGGSGGAAAASFGRNTVDVGGTLQLDAGAGANASAGGSVVIEAGTGGVTNGTGGDLTLAAGQRGGTGSSGVVLLRSGSGALPTAISNISGAGASAGQIQMYANMSSTAQGGGGILLGRGGELAASQAGYALLVGGTGSGGGNVGGQAGVLGGTGVTGGSVTILGGTATSSAGGAVTVRAGTGFAGGALNLQGGNAVGGSGGAGGHVLITPGAPDGAGSSAVVQVGPTGAAAGGFRINGVSQSNSTGIRAGSITINAIASSTSVGFGTTMASVPIVVVTPVKGATATAYSYWVDSITTTSFTIRRNSTADGAVPINWIAIAT